MAEYRRPSPFVAVSSILVSMTCIAVSSGLLFGYIPIKLAAENFPPWVSGMMITAVALGGVGGCLTAGSIVRRVSHARAFIIMAGIEIISFLLVAIGTYPAMWIFARLIYGFAVTGAFIVAQSWLNDATENEWRGRVIAMFYMIYVVSQGCGAFVLRFVELDGPFIPMLGVAFITLGIFPIALSRLPPPPAPDSISVAFRSVWQISPVGLMGLFAVGGTTMLILGFGPIYASYSGLEKNDVALLMFLMQSGMLLIQLPLGAISDRVDRRKVLLVSSVIVMALGTVLLLTDALPFFMLVVFFAVWAGASESIYSISNAHANDRADPQYYVALSSTLLIAWSISGFIVPALTTALTPVGGPKTFMVVAAVIAGIYSLFVVYRLVRTEPVPEPDTDPHIPMSGQIPYSAELAAGDVVPEVEQVTPGDRELVELRRRADELLRQL